MSHGRVSKATLQKFEASVMARRTLFLAED